MKEWVWSDDSRRERLCRLYNDTFNHTRQRTFNGDHLTLPGASQAVQLHAHQKAGVWRILQTSNTLLAHVVGAGKIYTMVAAGQSPAWRSESHDSTDPSGPIKRLAPGKLQMNFHRLSRRQVQVAVGSTRLGLRRQNIAGCGNRFDAMPGD